MYPNMLTNRWYAKRHYLTHPWKFFENLFYNLKYSWQRVTKGYCFSDWFNMDDWFLTVVPSMLREMANKGYGCPGAEPFETHEKWEAWLRKMADELEMCTEESEDTRNEYHEAYMRKIHGEIESGQQTSDVLTGEYKRDKVTQNYLNRAEELHRESMERIKSIFTELGEHFFCLWD